MGGFGTQNGIAAGEIGVVKLEREIGDEVGADWGGFGDEVVAGIGIGDLARR